MAIADGESRVRCGPLTDHTKTAIHVAEQMTDVRNEDPRLAFESVTFFIVVSFLVGAV